MGNKGVKGQPDTNVRMVFLGRVGAGKRATANTVLRKTLFEVGRGDTTTQQYRKPTGRNDGKEVMIANSNMMFAPDVAAVAMTCEMIRTVSALHPGPHVFVVVMVAGQITDQEYHVLSTIKTIYGQHFFKHAVVVLTRMDEITRQGQSLQAYLKTDQRLQETLGDFDNRVVGFNNKSNESDQVDNLTAIVAAMIQANKKRPYFTFLLPNGAAAVLGRELVKVDEHETKHIRSYLPKSGKKEDAFQLENIFNCVLGIRQSIRLAINTWIETRRRVIEEIHNTAALLDNTFDKSKSESTGAAAFGVINGTITTSGIRAPGQASLALSAAAISTSLAAYSGDDTSSLVKIGIESPYQRQLHVILNSDSFHSKVLLDEIRGLDTRLRGTINGVHEDIIKKLHTKTVDALIRQVSINPNGSMKNIDLRKWDDITRTVADVGLLASETASPSEADKDAGDAIVDIGAVIDKMGDEVNGNKVVLAHRLRVIYSNMQVDLKDKEAAAAVLEKSFTEFYTNQ